jgi:hypothetical protein
MIQNQFEPKKGRLFVHLLAKPKDTNAGFYHARKSSLVWTEMFILLLCRKKNPEILNIAGKAFLENCGIEGVTYPASGRGKAIKAFRDALGFDSFKGAKFAPTKKAAPQQPNCQSDSSADFSTDFAADCSSPCVNKNGLGRSWRMFMLSPDLRAARKVVTLMIMWSKTMPITYSLPSKHSKKWLPVSGYTRIPRHNPARFHSRSCC